MSELLKVLDEMTALRAAVARIEERLTVRVSDYQTIRPSDKETDLTVPLSAMEIVERWRIQGTNEQQLMHLARKCRRWGLRPLRGGRGWSALYARADVLRAESYAAGQLTKRKGPRA